MWGARGDCDHWSAGAMWGVRDCERVMSEWVMSAASGSVTPPQRSFQWAPARAAYIATLPRKLLPCQSRCHWGLSRPLATLLHHHGHIPGMWLVNITPSLTDLSPHWSILSDSDAKWKIRAGAMGMMWKYTSRLNKNIEYRLLSCTENVRNITNSF